MRCANMGMNKRKRSSRSGGTGGTVWWCEHLGSSSTIAPVNTSRGYPATELAVVADEGTQGTTWGSRRRKNASMQERMHAWGRRTGRQNTMCEYFQLVQAKL